MTRLVNVESLKIMQKYLNEKQLFVYPNTNIGYGTVAKADVYSESSPLQPKSLYGVTKVEGEEIVKKFPNYVIFRLASLFGVSPAMKHHLLLNFMIRKSVTEKSLIIYEAGAQRNFLHVSDMARGIIFAIQNNSIMKNQIYNIGIQQHYSKREIVDFLKIHCPDLYVNYAEFSSDFDKRDYYVSFKKMYDLGFEPEVTLEDGIFELIKYNAMSPVND